MTVSTESLVVQAARDARRRLELSEDIPIRDLFRLLDRKGLRVIRYPFEFREASALLARYMDEHFIVVDSARSLGHQVFSVAHEYGHFLEHQDHLAFVCNPSSPDAVAAPVERWANRFAAEFLMPRAAVERWLVEQGLDARGLSVYDAVRLQQALGVSFEAMLNRLGELGLITQDQRRAWAQESPSRLARRLGLPTDLYEPDRAVQVPEEYKVLWVQAYEAGKVTLARLRAAFDRIGMDVDDIDLRHPVGVEDAT